MINGIEALFRLREGNDRFVSGARRVDVPEGKAGLTDLVHGQEPFAVILGCSDSRVPVELIFDQGLGDLFVVRVAGNIVGPSQLGSIEFAVSLIRTRLVVVLGHTGCGAVRAALDDIDGAVELNTPGWLSISSRIRPSLLELQGEDPDRDWKLLYKQAVRANIKESTRQLREDSDTLRRLIEEDGLVVVGAEYSLETGAVDFFDRA